jgi:chromosome segregation ATPase
MQNMQNMQMQINGLVGVTQQLKMRCDNLTSEDVVRAMVDQFGTMYPEARNFNSSAQSLRNGLNSVQQQLALLQQQKAQPVEQFNEDVKKAAAKAEGAHSTAHTVFQEVQKHWKEINTIKQNVKTIETDVEKLKTNNDPKLNSPLRDAASDARINAEVTSLRNELDQTTKIASDANKLASAADSLSKQHASRFSKTKPEALEKRVAALESTVQDQTQKLGEGEPALKKLQDSAAQAKLEFERVKKNMGALKGRFELLEQGV